MKASTKNQKNLPSVATPARSDALVLFGVTGDLAYKKIFPALYGMAKRGLLNIPIIGVASSDCSLQELRDRVRESITTFSFIGDKLGDNVDDRTGDKIAENQPSINQEALEHLLSLFDYVKGDYQNAETFSALKRSLLYAKHPAHYLAIPPALFTTVIKGLGAASLADPSARDCRKTFWARFKIGH